MGTQSSWDAENVVARFSVSAGNETLHRFAEEEFEKRSEYQALDIGCGAGSNAIPLAKIGWKLLGLDRSLPMLEAAKKRAEQEGVAGRTDFQYATMENLPVETASQDLIIAHGIWNLAPSAVEFRKAVREAARVARSGAALFIYTFSRSTFPPDVQPVEGEEFVFTEFSGTPQCFLTEQQLTEELQAAGFLPETGITEYERIPGGKPAILEAIFRRRKN